MIRIAFECALVFLLPAALYFAYELLMQDPAVGAPAKPRTVANLLETAPLGWLFALGTACLLGTLLAFATLQEDGINQSYTPAIFKDGKIVKGTPK